MTCYYFYIWDAGAGAGFIKICTYAPYPVKVWLNGHDIARRKAAAAGIDVTPLANGFASASDPAALQELCDTVQAGTLRLFFDRWMSRIPVPLTPDDRDHDCWWQLSMRQVEVSRTLVFDDPRRVRAVFEELLAGNMNLGRPESVQVIFGSRAVRSADWEFSTRLLNRPDQVTVNLAFKHSRIKIYLKEDRALRIETVVNDPGDLGCKRGLEHLDELSAKARACNARLMDAEIAGQGSGILANPVFERIARPSADAAGHRVPEPARPVLSDGGQGAAGRSASPSGRMKEAATGSPPATASRSISQSCPATSAARVRPTCSSTTPTTWRQRGVRRVPRFTHRRTPNGASTKAPLSTPTVTSSASAPP